MAYLWVYLFLLEQNIWINRFAQFLKEVLVKKKFTLGLFNQNVFLTKNQVFSFSLY